MRLCYLGKVEIIIIMTNAGTLINLYYNLRTYFTNTRALILTQ